MNRSSTIRLASLTAGLLLLAGTGAALADPADGRGDRDRYERHDDRGSRDSWRERGYRHEEHERPYLRGYYYPRHDDRSYGYRGYGYGYGNRGDDAHYWRHADDGDDVALTIAGGVLGGIVGSHATAPANRVAGTVFGAIIGGVLGHAIGQSNNDDHRHDWNGHEQRPPGRRSF